MLAGVDESQRRDSPHINLIVSPYCCTGVIPLGTGLVGELGYVHPVHFDTVPRLVIT
jgi:hypothetical protein